MIYIRCSEHFNETPFILSFFFCPLAALIILRGSIYGGKESTAPSYHQCRKSQQALYKLVVGSLNVLRYITACIGLLTCSALWERIEKALNKSTAIQQPLLTAKE